MENNMERFIPPMPEKHERKVIFPTGEKIVLKDLIGHIWSNCNVEIVSYYYSKETGNSIGNKSKMEYYGTVEKIKPESAFLEYEVNWINSVNQTTREGKDIISITVNKWVEKDGSI